MIQSVWTDDNKLSQESNLTVSSHAGHSISSYILFNTLLPPTEWGLVNLKGNSRVSIPYWKRTRVACTNIPDRSHYSTAPPQLQCQVQSQVIELYDLLCLPLGDRILNSSLGCREHHLRDWQPPCIYPDLWKYIKWYMYITLKSRIEREKNSSLSMFPLSCAHVCTHTGHEMSTHKKTWSTHKFSFKNAFRPVSYISLFI